MCFLYARIVLLLIFPVVVTGSCVLYQLRFAFWFLVWAAVVRSVRVRSVLLFWSVSSSAVVT